MRNQDNQFFISALMMGLLMSVFPAVSWAGITDNVKDLIGISEFQQQTTIERTQDSIRIQRETHIQRTSTTEIIRGRDLKYAVTRFMDNTRKSLNNYFESTRDFVKTTYNLFRERAKDVERSRDEAKQQLQDMKQVQEMRTQITQRSYQDSMERNRDFIKSFKK